MPLSTEHKTTRSPSCELLGPRLHPPDSRPALPNLRPDRKTKAGALDRRPRLSHAAQDTRAPGSSHGLTARPHLGLKDERLQAVGRFFSFLFL